MSPPLLVPVPPTKRTSNRQIRRWIHRRSATGSTGTCTTTTNNTSSISSNIASSEKDETTDTATNPTSGNTTGSEISSAAAITAPDSSPRTHADDATITPVKDKPPTAVLVPMTWFRQIQEQLQFQLIAIQHCQAQTQMVLDAVQEQSLLFSSTTTLTTDHISHIHNLHPNQKTNIPTSTATHRVSFDPCPTSESVHNLVRPNVPRPPTSEKLPTLHQSNIHDGMLQSDGGTGNIAAADGRFATLTTTTTATTPSAKNSKEGHSCMECNPYNGNDIPENGHNDEDDEDDENTVQSMHSTQTIDPTIKTVSSSGNYGALSTLPKRRKRPFQYMTSNLLHQKKTTATTPTTGTASGPTKQQSQRNIHEPLTTTSTGIYNTRIPPFNSPTTTTTTLPSLSPQRSSAVPANASRQMNHSDTGQHDFVYHDVVRKRKERQQLPCYDCPNCSKFYRALRHSGHVEEDIAIRSSTGDSNKNTNTHNKAITCQGHGATSHHGFGRHRARFPPTSTPDDFWELDFIDER